MGKKNAFYAAPGANDYFLRPRVGHGYSPREIAVCAQDDGAWLSWIHRRNGEEYPVVTWKQPGVKRQGRLLRLDTGSGLFSKPVFLDSGAETPELFCAARGARGWEIRVYRVVGCKWQLCERLPTCCTAVYHMDAITAPDGRTFVFYAGITEARRGVSLFSRTRSKSKWRAEKAHPMRGASVNRPKLAVDSSGRVTLVVDAYRKSQFCIYTKPVDAGAQAWMRVCAEDGWQLFPSLIADAEGTLWVSWLRQTPVRRKDVMGLNQEARVARLVRGKWQLARDAGSPRIADLNLGLLPIKRYFGYDGLRRYPRLLAAVDGAVWLLWEQQRDEIERWENLANGYLCARRYSKGAWSKPTILLDGGNAFTFDSRGPCKTDTALVAAKSEHSPNGDDWRVVNVQLADGLPYRARPRSLWKGWKPCLLPAQPKNAERVTVEAKRGGKLKLFWGDLHCHSAFSPDAEGEVDELYFFARDLAPIDFVCVADNDFYPEKMLLDSEAHYTAHLAGSLTTSRFLALSGYEWTFHRPDRERSFNHRIVIFPDKERRIARRNESLGRSEKAFRKYLLKTQYFAFPHHAFWRLLDAPSEYAVEVTAAWGTYMLDAKTIPRALNAGRRFAFLGNSDSHRFMPGLSGALTGVYARDLTRSSIMDALRRGRCFATTGNKTALAFWVNNAFIGEEGRAPASPEIRWRIRAHGAIEKMRIIRNGEYVYSTSAAEGEWTDHHARLGENWYVLEVKEKGVHRRYPHNIAPAWGKYAWSSPIRVRV